MERTLFVFEGIKPEKGIFKSLENAFFGGDESRILMTFGHDIYELYKKLAQDDDLDPFSIISDLSPTIPNQEPLADLRRDQISQIYLFFDMEPHDDQFDTQNLLAMLAHFDNETEHGKLFISYPMAEALRDISDTEEYLTRTVNLADCTGKRYKGLHSKRGDPAFQDLRKIDKSLWQTLITANVQKANYLISGRPSMEPVIDQPPIAQAQLEDYLPQGQISVLSAFPIFLADYFGQRVYQL